MKSYNYDSVKSCHAICKYLSLGEGGQSGKLCPYFLDVLGCVNLKNIVVFKLKQVHAKYRLEIKVQKSNNLTSNKYLQRKKLREIE